jgi:hypothetical protein
MEKKESGRRQTVTTSLLLCFGGGVLLATAMLHILPEVPVLLCSYQRYQ